MKPLKLGATKQGLPCAGRPPSSRPLSLPPTTARALGSPPPPPCPSSLQALLTELQRNDASYSTNRARYLEAADDNGNTPLTAAAARGHLACVRLVRKGGGSSGDGGGCGCWGLAGWVGGWACLQSVALLAAGLGWSMAAQ